MSAFVSYASMYSEQLENASHVNLGRPHPQDSVARDGTESHPVVASSHHGVNLEGVVKMELSEEMGTLGLQNDAWYDTDLLAAEERLFALEAEVEASLSDLPALEQQHLLVVRQAILTSSKQQHPESLEDMQRQIAAAQSALMLLQSLPDKANTPTVISGSGTKNRGVEIKPLNANRLNRRVHSVVGRGTKAVPGKATCGESTCQCAPRRLSKAVSNNGLGKAGA